MTDRPIIFSGPMVKALIDGRKTQTRRIIKPQPEQNVAGLWVWPLDWVKGIKRYGVSVQTDEAGLIQTLTYDPARCVGYATGDRLWVRENCRAEELHLPPVTRATTSKERAASKRTEVTVPNELDGHDGVRYAADGEWRIIENNMAAADRWCELFHYRGRGKKGIGNSVPSIHMPRWASRLTLTVTDVRVQRLQDISEDDARAEGAKPWTGACQSYVTDFAAIWRAINGPGAWDANPWVAAISFTVQRLDIDETTT